MRKRSVREQLGIVLGGYLAAFLIASAAFYVRYAITSRTPDSTASSGMYAFGDSIVFVFVFGFAALVPTGFALYFLRAVRWFWTAVTIAAVSMAATGVAAAILFWTTRTLPQGAPLYMAGAFSVLRMIVSPLLTAVVLACAFFAPEKQSRRMLAIAAAVECAATAPWFVWMAAAVVRSR